MHCPGPWDHASGKQSGPDYCMPMKSGDCWNSCPVSCGEHDQVCPGSVKDDGCQEPEFCHDMNGKVSQLIIARPYKTKINALLLLSSSILSCSLWS